MHIADLALGYLDCCQHRCAGTVVDRDITHPTENAFFLMSHAGLKGTSRPTHYHVLYDANNFGPDILQGFSYK